MSIRLKLSELVQANVYNMISKNGETKVRLRHISGTN